MQNLTANQTPAASEATDAPRRRRRRSPVARNHVVRCRLAADAYACADQQAARLGLAVAAWVALLGLDVALRRPALGVEQLENLRADRDRLRLIGSTVNAMAAAENRGRAVPDRQLAAALERVQAAAARAREGLAHVEQVFAPAPAPAGPSPLTTPAAPPEFPGARRQPAPAGVRRDRVVFTRLTARERDVMVRAAVAEGLAVGGWLGQVAEDPDHTRRCLLGEQYTAVERLRQTARRLATNLGQLADIRTARRASTLPQLAAATADVDELLRHAWHVRGLVAAAGQLGE
jgi:hypothetical protein